MKTRYPIIIGLILTWMLLIPSISISSGSETEDPAISMSRIVSRALDHISSYDRDHPLMPPVDATSVIRMIQDGTIETNGPSRTDPIPLNWDLVATNTHSKIYVEEGLSVSSSDITAIGDVFDEKIYPNATDWFHPSNPYNIIEIRIYDFGDGPGNVGGFFFASFATRDHMYVDSEDLEYSRDWTFEIVAHEFQHLLHYDQDMDEEVWLNEGLADLSARVCLGPGTEGIQSHIEAYEIYPDNDLLIWDEGTPPDNIETIADYGRAYAFVSYLAYHYGGKAFINDLVGDPRNSISSIDGELAEDGNPDRFGDVLMKESVSNVVDDLDYGGGIYYQGLIDIGIRTYEKNAASYPSSHTISSTSRYSPYMLKYRSDTPGMGVLISSSSPVEGTMIGVDDNEIIESINFTNGGSGTFRYEVSRFGRDYDTLFILPHTSSSGSSIDVTVERSDLEPPVTEITVSPGAPDGKNGFYTTSPGILLESDTATRIFYAWNEGAFQEYTATLHPPEGTSLLRYYAEGSLGLIEEEREVHFKVDLTDPFIDIAISPEEPDGINEYYITQPLVNLTTDDDAVPFYDLGDGPLEYSENLAIDSGEWTLKYWAEDRAGRTSQLSLKEIKVDLTDPDLTYSIEPDSPDGLAGYYVTEPLITLVPEGASIGYYTINGGDPVEYSAPFSLPDGEYEIDIFAMDPSGMSSTHITEFIKVDTMEPDLSFRFSEPIGSDWISKPTYLSISSGDPLADIEFKLGDDGPFSYISDILLTDGDYTVEFWATDPAGNIANGGSRNVMIDTNFPSTTLVMDRDPDSGAWFHDTPPVISFETASLPVSKETTYFSLDGEEFIEYKGQDIGFLAGINSVYFYSIDLAGNREETRVRDIGLDLSLPSPQLSSNRTLIPVRGPVKFSAAGSTDDNEVYRFRLDFGDGRSSEWIYGNTTEHQYSSLGDYRVTITMQDISGRETTIENIIHIEVVTQEEYDRRMSDNGLSIMMILVSLIILIAVALVVVLVVIMVRRRGYEEAIVVAEVEWEEESPY